MPYEVLSHAGFASAKPSILGSAAAEPGLDDGADYEMTDIKTLNIKIEL